MNNIPHIVDSGASVMNNEPVAWGFFDKDGVIYDCVTNRDYCGENGKPLYTHPAKTLTDEEIDDIGREHLTDGDGAIEFARAILKKASEK
jgi:hypothetical protein